MDSTGIARKFDEVVHLPRKADLLSKRRHAPFKAEKSHRYTPTVTRFSDDEISLRAGVGEEDLVEFSSARDLNDRSNLYTLLLHGNE